MKRMIAVILACLLLASCSVSAPVTKQYFVMDTDHVILSALTPEIIAGRFAGKQDKQMEETL